MKEQCKTYKLKSGNILRVERDPLPASPDELKNEDIFLVYDHRQFTVKREGFKPKDIFIYLESKIKFPNAHKKEYENDKFNDYYIFPVDAYIHSDIHLSLAGAIHPRDIRFDIITTGYILVKKSMIEEELITPNEDHKEAKAREFAESLIETWNQYLSGDIWGYQILKSVNYLKIKDQDLIHIRDNSTDIYNSIVSKGELIEEYEELDSCWGFYGDNPKENGMLEYIGDQIIEDHEKE